MTQVSPTCQINCLIFELQAISPLTKKAILVSDISGKLTKEYLLIILPQPIPHLPGPLALGLGLGKKGGHGKCKMEGNGLKRDCGLYMVYRGPVNPGFNTRYSSQLYRRGYILSFSHTQYQIQNYITTEYSTQYHF